MRLLDLFQFSTDNLRRRKGRTILTIIGVVVGVCAIVVMISLGIAVNRATDDMLKGWGDLTKIEVMRWGAQSGTPDLDDDMVAQFREIPHVVGATPMYQTTEFYGNIAAGSGNRYLAEGAMIVGVDPTALEAMGYELETGNFDIAGSGMGNRIPILIGNQTPFSFRDAKKSWSSPNSMKSPMYDENYIEITNLPNYDENGTLLNPDDFFFDVMHSKLTFRMEVGYDETRQEIKYKDYELVPVGMIKGSMNDWMVSNSFIMSLDNMKKLEKDHKRAVGSSSGGGGGMVSYAYGGQEGTVEGYDSVFVKIDDVDNMADAEKQIKEIGYQISSLSETRDQLMGQVAQTQLMLGGLAAISLFVAALNIMNTMTMAITERTREIGVMKVLGCSLGNIRGMFLVESGAIGFVGGIAGCMISFLLSFVLNHISQILSFLQIQSDFDIASAFGLGGLTSQVPDAKLSIIPLWLYLFSLVFATIVGLISGIAPANRAVKISSLEAIRHE
ncbi:MAG: ABC transporter permease [Clostridiales Family XIII bacterium]|jgi:ABC-type antimicrobial peptide transport system permease subunit|nr:ABC transporter permease [Clostridiales Family XIII bacterium]